MSANDLNVVDVIPQVDSGETGDNSEPSIAVNPADPSQLIAGSFGGSVIPFANAPYFVSLNGGVTWSNFGGLGNSDKTIAWIPNGSAVLTATLVGPDEPLPLGEDPDEGGGSAQLNMYSASQSEVTGGGDFGSTINNFVGSDDNDQPWLRISADGQVYMAYNNLGNSGGSGETASVNVSTDGGSSYSQVISLDRIGGSPQDDPAIRLAVSGTTTYAVFDRWTHNLQDDAAGERWDATLVVDKSVIGGADAFTALGAGGNGADVSDHIGVFTRSGDAGLTIGLNRIAGGDIAIAVDPNNQNHVVVAYIDSPGVPGSDVVQLVIAESEDGGTTWSQKYTTSETARTSQPALSILDDGTIGFLYDAYDPSTNELSQHFVTTSNDFASTNDFTLGTETNNAFPTATESPYLGDFFDLSSVGDTFYGIFSALNFDNGDPTTGAAFTNVSFQRDFTGSAGTSNFQLTNSSGRAVSESVDPFAFTLSGAGTTTQFVSSGVVSSGAAVTSGNVLEVLSGGSANATSVGSSGTEQVDAGANASGTIVSGGGTEVVYGSETGAALRGGTLEVLSGGVASGATVSNGATLEIWSSGTAINTTVLSGGTLAYFSGANANGVTFSAGATLEAASGYVASGLTVSSGLTLAVGAQGSAVSNTILGGGSISLLFGGQTSGTIVSSGGVETISFLGSASGTTVDSGGVQDILSGGVASSTVVQAGGSETVGPSGKAVDATVASGGSLIMSSGGSLELVGSDTLSGVTLLPGAIVLVGSGYTLSGYVVNSGITLGVLSGGTASNTTVLSGGAFEYFAGESDSGTVFDSGAIRIIGYNRIETSRSVDASSPLEVAFGGQANSTSISSGGVESVLAGGVDSGGEVHASGTQIVYAGGTASGAQVDSGGLQALSGGTAVDATIDGKENVFSGGLDSVTTINDGGSAGVASGGLIIYGLLSGTLSVLSGGLATSITIATGGLENVSSGGLDSGTRISTGGIEVASSGGMTSSAVIENGGLLGLFGGTAIWTTISSGGFESVSSGGLDSAAIMSVGGSELVQPGGVASGAILSGGVLTVSAGGAAVDTTIDNTAQEVVSSGGTIGGVTSVNGGTLALLSGALVSGGVELASGGTVLIGDTTIPANLVLSGFALGDAIDLASVPFDSNGTTTTSGNVLTVSEGGHSYNISFSTSLAGSQFALVPDGGGGTDVLSGSPVSPGQTILITSGQVSTGLAVLSGSIVDVLSGGTASATTLTNGSFEQVIFGSSIATRIMSGGALTNIGGATTGTTVGSGGTETLSSGGVDADSIINPGGRATVSSSGVASSATVNSGGVLVLSGGAAISTTIAPDGREDVFSGGIDSGAVISWGGNETVHSGGTTSNTTVSSDGFLDLSGGTAVSVTISDGGTERVWRGGVDSGALVDRGGEMDIESGGSALATIINRDAFVTVQSGGTAEGTIVAGSETISAGGTISGALVANGGRLDLANNALVSGGVAFSNNGTLVIRGDTIPANLVVSGFYFADTINLADVAFDSGGTTSTSGNVLTVSENGHTYHLSFSTDLSGYEFELEKGDSGTDITLSKLSQTIAVDSGQTSSGISVLSGVTIDVHSGGVVSASAITDGGLVRVSAGGEVSGVTVLSSGTLEYFSGAVVDQVSFAPGAIFEIGSGNLGTGLTANDGLTIKVVSGGAANGAAIGSGGTEVVLSGGIDSAATITSDGVAYISSGGETSGAIVSSGGILAVTSGGEAVSATIGNGGLEGVLAGGLDSAAQITSGGTMFVYSGGIASAAVISGGTMELMVGGGASGAITFAGAGGTLQIDGTTMPANTISGLLPGDMFYLPAVPFDSSGSADLLPGNVLQITEGDHFYDLHLDPSQDFSGKFFQLNPVTSGGTLVTEENIPCYCAGTLILTERGEVEVERVAIGDNLITADGAVRPVRWIGRRSYAGRFARGSHVLPICIKAGALDVDQPRRNLWISPQHAMFLDGVLIEAIDLINGVSISQADHVERVDYFHIELDTHDVIIAEGALSESFVDDDSRGIFQNAHEFAALYPDAATVRPARYCAPRLAFGTQVETARRRIAQRAGIAYTRPSTAQMPRALVIDSRLPQIGHDGGANAILDHMRALQVAGFEVSFLALQNANSNAIALSSLGVTLLSMPPSGLFSDFARAHAGRFDLIYLHRVETATRCLKLAQRYFDAQIVYSVADLHHLRLKGQSELDPDHAAELMHQARDVALQELGAALSADWVITHSVSEAEQLQQMSAIADKVRVIPWALRPAPVATRFADRSGVAFIGAFEHAPNVDAARWLVYEIMPLVWRTAPEIRCLIIGSGLSAALRPELAQPGIDVLGRVDDLATVLERIRLTVAPLRFGAGLKDKVLRSLAAGLPCIGTPEALRGMQVLPAAITNMCQGETASELAAAIVRLHQHESANAACAQIGLSYIDEFYNQSRIDELMQEIARPALDRQRAARPKPDCKILNFGERPRHMDDAAASDAEQRGRRLQFRQL